MKMGPAIARRQVVVLPSNESGRLRCSPGISAAWREMADIGGLVAVNRSGAADGGGYCRQQWRNPGRHPASFILFDVGPPGGAVRNPFVPSRDGRKFLAIAPPSKKPPTASR